MLSQSAQYGCCPPSCWQVTNRYNSYGYNGAKTSAFLLQRPAVQAERVTSHGAACLPVACSPCPADCCKRSRQCAAHSHPHARCPPSSCAAVILSTNSWVGGRNNFLGACYIAVGGVCLLTALFFFLGYDLGEPLGCSRPCFVVSSLPLPCCQH